MFNPPLTQQSIVFHSTGSYWLPLSGAAAHQESAGKQQEQKERQERREAAREERAEKERRKAERREARLLAKETKQASWPNAVYFGCLLIRLKSRLNAGGGPLRSGFEANDKPLHSASCVPCFRSQGDPWGKPALNNVELEGNVMEHPLWRLSSDSWQQLLLAYCVIRMHHWPLTLPNHSANTVLLLAVAAPSTT